MADAGTGNYGILRIDVSETGLNPAANTSVVNYAFYLIENGGSNASWASGISAAVYTTDALAWSGSFNFDWRSAGNQTVLIASGSVGVAHNADGSRSFAVRGDMGATGTSGAGGPTSVQANMTLTKLTQLPGTPTGLSAARVSDTQINLAWSQANPSNGAPTATDIDVSINNGAYVDKVNIGGATSASVSAAANQKLVHRVRSGNAAGYTGFSTFAAVYTTPAAPTNAVATKQANLDIIVTWTDNVAYAEHTHEVWHGTITGGVTTWDGAALATIPNGTTTYTHTAPDPSKVHVYQIRAVAGALTSAYAVSNSVQLLVAPNKPTIPAMPAYADKASALVVNWVHNSVDTTPQSAYEFSTSTDGGTTWTSSGKVASTVSQRTIAANTYAANQTLTMRVRTWGAATTGGSDTTGASPWSDLTAVTFKTAPTATITSPANGGTVNDATLRVNLGFSQPEGATFVKAQLELQQPAGTVVETLDSTILIGIQMATPVQNGLSYVIRARVQDSNGVWSAWKSNTFNVVYLAPVPAGVAVQFLQDNGYAQIDLTIPAPVAGQAAATTVTITRKINGGTEETLFLNYPVSATLTFLDTVPTVHGTNTYTVTTTSALGAQTVRTADLVTTECRRAYLSKGQGYTSVAVFGGNLSVNESLGIASDTVSAAGRTKPIGLYGVETQVSLKVSSYIFENFGSTIDQIRAILLQPGKACYRDPSGRRVFGAAKGSIAYKKTNRGDLSFTIEETS